MKVLKGLKDWASQKGDHWHVWTDPPPRRRRGASPFAPMALVADRLPGEAPPQRLRNTSESFAEAAGPARSRHALIAAQRVIGALVVNADGASRGQIRDLSIEKASGRVLYAMVSFEGVFGFGARYLPVPWALLAYDAERDVYAMPFDRESLETIPSLSREDLEWFGSGDAAWRARMAAYYGPYFTIPFI
jgi:hypothetical protein